MSFLQRSVLALRVLLWVLAVSLGVFVLATGLGVMHERDRMLMAAHGDVQKTLNGNMGAIAVALWSYDTPSMTALLRGMTQSGALVKIDIQDDQAVLASATRVDAGRVDKVWTVPVMAPDGKKQIGTLSVSESYVEVDKHIQAATVTLVITQLVEVIGLAFIIFIIVYRLIARHLHALAEDVVALDPSAPGAVVAMDRDRVFNDELDTLVTAINRYLRDRSEEMDKRSAAESSLREHMAEIEVMLAALSDGVIAVDGECRVRYANSAARNFLNAYDRQVEGMLLDELLHFVLEPDGRLLDGLCRTVVVEGVPVHMRGNVRIRPTTGIEFDAKVSAVPAPDSGDVAMILVFTDISAEISKERQIEFQAFHDPLTRLGNRSLLTRDLARDIDRAARQASRLAVLCLDLDNFKNINDALGHGVGDVMLRQLAQRLLALVAGSAWVTRHGGDEFIVVLPDIEDGEQAATLAEQIMVEIARPFRIEPHELRVTSSIGISLYPDHGVTIAELVSNADMAMYEAKRDSRNAYRFYELGLLHRSTERLSMENGLRVALAEKQFALVFQPKTTIATGRINSLEALLRWPGAPGGAISPAVFIPVAEDTGLIIEIGAWVLRESLFVARRLREQLGYSLPIAVNVSPIQFRSEHLMNNLELLASIEPDLAELLEIELTESALSGNIPEVTKKLNKLKEYGFKIAIDDFGTGYSSLAYLKNFPIDILKIDQAFIRELHVNAQDKAIVGSIVQLGKSLGFDIVAEGVEEKEHVEILADLGCDLAQGYWFARPMPEADVIARYRQS